ncbi:MAG: VOC family protein [Deltaproteobacteria bacterium]|nr:VOC family protein [Deltaproteobacteria bacterium]
MISIIDHVSIAVRDYEKAENFFMNILEAIPCTCAEDDRLKFYWQIYSLGNLSRLELIKATGKGSFLENFLADKEGGVHHITLETPSIEQAIKRLEENNIPYFGHREMGDAWKEIFIHPKDAFGVLIQIAEFNPDDWLSDAVKFSNHERWFVEKTDTGCQLTFAHPTDTGCQLTFAHPGGGKVNLSLTHTEVEDLVKNLQEVI